jgi:hypothetical protein
MQTEIVKALMGAAGAVGGATYVDDVFSTYVYRGLQSARSINNGIDLSGEGGMVWIKRRNVASDHILNDTVRGAGNRLNSNSTNASSSGTGFLSAFNSNGFSVGTDAAVNFGHPDPQYSGTYSSWSFRKAPGFFDVVTYNGDADNLDSGESQSVAHSLGSEPGLILVKKTSGSQPWAVYHRSLGNTKSLFLQSTEQAEALQRYWNNTSPTSTHFTVGSSAHVNRTGESYVAYVFGHDDQSFGKNENASVIKTGSYVGNGSTDGPEINLGWEPQWVLFKNASSSYDWRLYDSMRGIVTGENDSRLMPNLSNAEETTHDKFDLTPTGFKIVTTNSDMNENGGTITYIAIRRSDGYVGKPPVLGTDVFAMDTGAGSSTIPNFDSGFPVDFAFARQVASSANWDTSARLIGTNFLRTDTNGSQGTSANFTWDSNVGWNKHSNYNSGAQSWMWKRHAGFDVCTWTGNAVAGRQIPHSLSKSPEMIWVKTRSQNSQNWMVGHKGLDGGNNPWEKYINLNTGGSENDYPVWNDQAPTSTHFSLGTVLPQTNNNNETYIAMLFASVDGISKVGYYNGSSSDLTITTGFQPRFAIIKNITDNNESWMVLDTTRGWASGNDQRLWLDESTAQAAYDTGAPTSTGFTLTGGLNDWNNTGKKYIYYAHS